MRFLAAALLLFATSALALDPPYLSHWPSVERVLADHAVVDEDDTLARQMSALNVLQNSIEYMAGPRRWHGLTPDEQRLRGEYYRAADRIRSQVHATLSNERQGQFGQAPLQKWNGRQWGYEGDPRFRHATLARYLPAEAVARIEAETPANLAPRKGGESKGLTGWLPWVAGIAVLLLLLRALRGLSGRRRVRSAAPADAEANPYSESAYAALSDADRDLLTRAGSEVFNSLEPYILAAQVDGRPLPTAVLLDDDVLGYLSMYNLKALQVEGASEAAIERLSHFVLVHQSVIAAVRMNRLFGGDGPSADEAPERRDPTRQHPMRAGNVRAIHALQAFKSTKAEPLSSLDDDEPVMELALAGEPPATRLHPPGPNAAQAQQLVLRYFSARLVTAARTL